MSKSRGPIDPWPSRFSLYGETKDWHKPSGLAMRALRFLIIPALWLMNSCVPGPNFRAHPQNQTLASCAPLNASATSRPGQRPDGSVLLPNQWALHPTGTQVDLGDFPVNIALHTAGRFAGTLHAGYREH